MTYKTHVVFSTALAIPIAYLFGYEDMNLLAFLSFSALGSLLPDLDEEGSYIGRKIPIIPFFLKLFGVTHRGVTHIFISVLILFIVLYFVQIKYPYEILLPISFGVTLGYLFHLFGDMLTKGGIKNFYFPISKKKGVLLPRAFRFYTGSQQEFFIFIILFMIVVIEAFLFLGNNCEIFC